MITLRVENGYNERYAPGGAKKAYIARITGRDNKMTFAREFHGKEVMVDEPGLYELRTTDKKGRPDDEYLLVYRDAKGKLIQSTKHKEFAMKLAKLLDSRSIDSCIDEDGEIQTEKQAEKAIVARTIDELTEQIWMLLQVLPEATAKKVLNAVKARVSPKIVAETPLTHETPCGINNDYQQEAGATAKQSGMDPTPIGANALIHP